MADDVECLRFEWPRNGYGLNVACRSRNGKSRTVEIGDLEWAEPYPEGLQWIEAYLAWRNAGLRVSGEKGVASD